MILAFFCCVIEVVLSVGSVQGRLEAQLVDMVLGMMRLPDAAHSMHSSLGLQMSEVCCVS